MKGMFTQGAAVLFTTPPSLDSLASCFQHHQVLAKRPASSEWAMGGPTLLLPLRREVNGLWAVDVVEQLWPDTMGDPQQSPMVFGAWSMGHFGPFAYPGNLERASAQSWISPEVAAVVARHRAFVRIRSSYIFGAGQDAKVVPPDYDPVDELMQLTGIVRELLTHPDALCYFNPNGEVLADRNTFDETAAFNGEHQQPHVDLWTNVRMWNAGDGFQLMDTVGLSQLDLDDHEAVFRTEVVSPDEVARFLRNLSMYSVTRRPRFADAHTIDGPGGLWRVRQVKDGAVSPPRPVLRWARDGERLPTALG
jgi:hypothetical protein